LLHFLFVCALAKKGSFDFAEALACGAFAMCAMWIG